MAEKLEDVEGDEFGILQEKHQINEETAEKQTEV